MTTVYIIINLIVVLATLAFFRRPFRITCGLLSGLVLLSSSLFHLIYGEGYIADYDQYSWDWWTDTYEITVQLTYVLLFITYSWSVGRVSLIFPFNLAYLGAGLAYYWIMSPTADVTIGYNACGVLLGSLWTVERVTRTPLRTTEEEDTPLVHDSTDWGLET